MLVHSVYFWLKADRTGEQIAAFEQGLESLRGIPTAKHLHIGRPAATPERPVIDNSYTFGLAVLFDVLAEHDAYQSDPLHKAFLAQFASYWDRVQIYDFD